MCFIKRACLHALRDRPGEKMTVAPRPTALGPACRTLRPQGLEATNVAAAHWVGLLKLFAANTTGCLKLPGTD